MVQIIKQGMVNELELDLVFRLIVIIFLTGCMLALALWKTPKLANGFSHGVCALGSAVMMFLAWTVLQTGETVLIVVGHWLHAGEVALRIDPLAAFFLLLLSVLGTVASIYAVGYTSEHY